jgi:hypothetical protein
MMEDVEYLMMKIKIEQQDDTIDNLRKKNIAYEESIYDLKFEIEDLKTYLTKINNSIYDKLHLLSNDDSFLLIRENKE